MRVQNMGFTLLIMLLFANVMSGKIALICGRLAKPLLQTTLLEALIIFLENTSPLISSF